MSLEEILKHLPRLREIDWEAFVYDIVEKARIDWRCYTSDNAYVIGIHEGASVFIDEVQGFLMNDALVFADLESVHNYQSLEVYPLGTKVEIFDDRLEVIRPTGNQSNP